MSCSQKKVGNSDRALVGSSGQQRENVTLRRQRNKAPATTPLARNLNMSNLEASKTTSVSDKEAALSHEIYCLRQEMSIIREQLGNAVTVIQSYGTKLENYALQVERLNAKIQVLESTRQHSPQPLPNTQKTVSQTTNTNPPLPKQNNPAQKSIANLPVEPTRVTMQKGATGISTDLNNRTTLCDSCPEPDVAMQTTLPTQPDHQTEWTQVTSKKRRPLSLYGTAGPAVTTLKAVDSCRYIHLWNMQSTADEVRTYLIQLCSTDSCTVEELTPRGNYKSYKLGVPAVHYNTCMSTEVWPANSRIKPWFQRIRLSRSDKPVPNQQPFRDSSASKEIK